MKTSTHVSGTGAATHHSVAERALLALGIDPDVAEAVVGDLAEEFEARRTLHGDVIARLYVIREVLLSFPPFVWHAIRHGSPRVRARIAAFVAGVALVVTAVTVALLARSGPPARLFTDVGNGSNDIVVNNLDPVQLQVQAVDKRGRRVSAEGVQFRWASGAPASVSPAGVLTCTHDGDVTIHASLGSVTTELDVLCRRVVNVEASSWIDLVVGDAIRPLPYVARGVDSNPVRELRGQASITDSSVATLVGANIRPRSVGRTHVSVRIGERRADMLVTVHERVKTLDRLRRDQLYVALPVQLARGDTVHWTLPHEAFWLAYLPRHQGDAPPTIILDGLITCAPSDAIHQYFAPLDEPRMYCIVHSSSAVVTLAHGLAGAPTVEGSLLFERVDQWRAPQ